MFTGGATAPVNVRLHVGVMAVAGMVLLGAQLAVSGWTVWLPVSAVLVILIVYARYRAVVARNDVIAHNQNPAGSPEPDYWATVVWAVVAMVAMIAVLTIAIWVAPAS